MESSMFFCAQCGEVMKPFINDPDLMVCEPCGTFESIDATTPPEGYDPTRYQEMVELAQKLRPETVAMLLIDGNDAIANLNKAIQGFLTAWKIEQRNDRPAFEIPMAGTTHVIVPGYDEARFDSLSQLWEAVNQKPED